MTTNNTAVAETSQATKARVLLVVAAVMWSMSGLFAKAPWLNDWPVESRGTLLAFWRTMFAGIFLLPLVRKPQWSWRLIPTTIIFTLMNLTFLNAMARTTAANAIWLQNTAPIWVVAFGFIFQKTRLGKREIATIIIAGIGVGVILCFELRTANEINRYGITLGVLGGLAFAAVIISLRWVRDLEAAWIVVTNHLVTAGLLLPFVVQTDIYPTYSQAIWLAGFGVIQLGLPYILFTRALQQVPSHEASFIVLLEPLLVPVWVFIAWRNQPSYQPPSWWTFVGGTFILLGLIVLYTGPKNRS